MINIFDQIKEFIQFDSNDDFFYLQIIQRKKENKTIGSNSKVIKNYYIRSKTHLDLLKDEIIGLCDFFNARAMIRLNRRSFKRVAFQTMIKVANTVSNESYKTVMNSYDSCCRKYAIEKKSWILDIDGEYDEESLKDLVNYIDSRSPFGEKLIMKLPTKNGIHLIVKPFDKRDFNKVYPKISVHKDNPVNLYIP